MKINIGRECTDTREAVTTTFQYVLAVVFMFSGIFFSIYSMLEDIMVVVLTTRMPGLVLGLPVAYLGLIHFLSAEKHREECNQGSCLYSWDDFMEDEKTSSES